MYLHCPFRLICRYLTQNILFYKVVSLIQTATKASVFGTFFILIMKILNELYKSFICLFLYLFEKDANKLTYIFLQGKFRKS